MENWLDMVMIIVLKLVLYNHFKFVIVRVFTQNLKKRPV